MTKISYINGSPLPWLIGGSLCLDFVNTVEPRDGMLPNALSRNAHKLERREYLRVYDDLVAWGIHAAILSPSVAQRLNGRAQQHPAQAQATLAHALELRETIYRMFWMVAHSQAPNSDDMGGLLHEVAQVSPHVQLIAHGDQLEWRWQVSDALDQILWPVLSDAMHLLIRGDPTRIRMCPGVPDEPICGWLFYDASKNRSRHWCSMEDCGGAAKARRQTARRRTTNAGR